MKVATVRALIAFTVIGVFMTITAFMAIYPLVTPATVQLTEYSDFFAKTASVYTGIIGVIVGYYFARTEERKAGVEDKSKNTAHESSKARNLTGNEPAS